MRVQTRNNEVKMGRQCCNSAALRVVLVIMLPSAFLLSLLSGWTASLSAQKWSTKSVTAAGLGTTFSFSPNDAVARGSSYPRPSAPASTTLTMPGSLPPRPQTFLPPEEAPVTVGNRGGTDYLQCIRRYLMLDEEGQPRMRTTDMTHAIPLLITPFTTDGDLLSFPTLACTINVPVRYHYIVVNARSEKVRAFMEELTQVFGDSGRLFIQRNRVNMGYAGSMNQGLRWGMEEHTNAEVPWAVMANNDVELGYDLLPRLVRVARKQSAADAPVLAALQAEVQQEQLWADEGNLTYYHTYVPPGRPLVVLREGAPGVPKIVRTSALLPDRLRYQRPHRSIKGRKYEPTERFPFSGHAGIITVSGDSMPFMALTRLMVSTVGYLDENFFPAYMEDIDLRWRAFALGFHQKKATPRIPGTYGHINGVNVRQRTTQADTEFTSDAKAYHTYLGRAAGSTSYKRLKYGDRLDEAWGVAPWGASYAHIFFNASYYPADLWIDDYEFRSCFFQREWKPSKNKFQSPRRCRFGLHKLATSGALTTEQYARVVQLIDVYGLPKEGI